MTSFVNLSHVFDSTWSHQVHQLHAMYGMGNEPIWVTEVLLHDLHQLTPNHLRSFVLNHDRHCIQGGSEHRGVNCASTLHAMRCNCMECLLGALLHSTNPFLSSLLAISCSAGTATDSYSEPM